MHANVLVQTDADTTNYRFPVAVYNDFNATDVTVRDSRSTSTPQVHPPAQRRRKSVEWWINLGGLKLSVQNRVQMNRRVARDFNASGVRSTHRARPSVFGCIGW
jgi:hypothetical protein